VPTPLTDVLILPLGLPLIAATADWGWGKGHVSPRPQ
jgi:hypothetical protein